MNPRVMRRAFCIALVVSLGFAGQVSAASCYYPNNGAAVVLASQAVAKGLQARQELTAATPHSASTAIVHPLQIGMASGDFVGWGTAMGVGTNDPNALSDCPDNPGPRWAIYVDGIAFGYYFCRQSYGSTDPAATSQDAEIIHGTCNGATQWTFKWNGTVKTCETVSGAGGTPSVGAESIGYDPQNVDIRDHRLTYRILGGTWTDWYSGGEQTCTGSYYSVTKNSATDFRFHD